MCEISLKLIYKPLAAKAVTQTDTQIFFVIPKKEDIARFAHRVSCRELTAMSLALKYYATK